MMVEKNIVQSSPLLKMLPHSRSCPTDSSMSCPADGSLLKNAPTPPSCPADSSLSLPNVPAPSKKGRPGRCKKRCVNVSAGMRRQIDAVTAAVKAKFEHIQSVQVVSVQAKGPDPV